MVVRAGAENLEAVAYFGLACNDKLISFSIEDRVSSYND